MKIQINKLKNWEANPRNIKAENFKKLKKSIQDDPKFLDYHKLIAYKEADSEEYIVIAGNMRLKACKELGIKELDVEVMTDAYNKDGVLNTTLIKNRGLKHNIEYGQYDYDLLSSHFDELDLAEFLDIDYALNIIDPSDAYYDPIEGVLKHTNEDILKKAYDKDIITVQLSYTLRQHAEYLDLLEKAKIKSGKSNSSEILLSLLKEYAL